MTHWNNLSANAFYSAGTRRFTLLVTPATLSRGCSGFNWEVANEVGRVLRSGNRKTFGQAKSSATRAAKASLNTVF